jgi:hypothetical protein
MRESYRSMQLSQSLRPADVAGVRHANGTALVGGTTGVGGGI